MVATAERNGNIRSDGSIMLDRDSAVVAEFSIFVDWLYSSQLLDEDESHLNTTQLMRLYKFAVKEEVELLKDDILTDLCRCARDYPEFKPNPAIFYQFAPDSMLCKLVADIWSNHADGLHSVDITRAITKFKDPAPMVEFMRLAWSQSNKKSGAGSAALRSPCDFHEHPETYIYIP
jgi:hypothetical protein